MSLDWRSPLIFAHRGASAHAPENTLSAFKLAIDEQADLIEFDAKLSADEQVVIIHDQTVDRTTDGKGYVKDLPLRELRKLNASAHFPNFTGKAYIPTLEEIIENFGGNIRFNIELSNYSSPFDPLPIKVATLIEYYDIIDQVLVSSFHPIPLMRFHRLLPSVPIGFLARPGNPGALSRSRLGRLLVPYHALHVAFSDTTPNLVSATQSSGSRVHTFTVNDPDDITTSFSLGVDGVITDYPLIARQILESIR